MRKGIIVLIAGLWILAGCGSADKEPGIPVGPKWKGAPYRIAFDAQTGKPGSAGVSIPPIKYTANPDALENRVTLVVRFDAAEKTKGQAPVANRMITPPVDIHGPEGALPADYMERASKGLSTFLTASCINGKVSLSVALARSSLNPQAGDGEVDQKRLSDWLPMETTFKNPHPKC